METEKTLDDLTQDYEELLGHLQDHENIPDWFNVIFKNILNKTISLEEWNTFMNYIQNNSSDINSISAFVQSLYEYLEDLGPISPTKFYTKEESDNKYQTKNAMSNYYNKNEADTKYQTKSGMSSYYDKTEADNKFQTISASETALALKADKSTTYTKNETNALLTNKQPTLVSGTNIKTINNESLLGSGNIEIVPSAVVTITGNSSSGTFTQDEYDLLYNSDVSFIKFNSIMYYRNWSADGTPSMDFKTIPYVSTTIPNYRLEQKQIRVNPDRTWEHGTIRKDYAKENIGIIDMGANTDTEGTFTSTQVSYLTQNTISTIIKNGLYYYRAGSSYNLYLYRSLPEITYNNDNTITQTYRLLSVNTTSNEWWDYEKSFTI